MTSGRFLLFKHLRDRRHDPDALDRAISEYEAVGAAYTLHATPFTGESENHVFGRNLHDNDPKLQEP